MDILELNKFKQAELGICSTWHGDQLVERLIYDGIEMIKHLIEEDNMGEDEAAEGDQKSREQAMNILRREGYTVE